MKQESPASRRGDVNSPTHRSDPRPAVWLDKPMPDAERRLLTTLSAGVWLIALAMNVSHVYDHLGQSDIAIDPARRAVLCWAPDVLLLVGVWRLRYRPRSVVAWAMVAAGLGWLAWSALSTAHGTLSAGLLAVAPIGVAVLTTLALEFRHAEAVAPATELEVSAPDSKPEPRDLESVPPEPPTISKPAPKPPQEAKPAAKRPAPSREQARAILGALDSLDDKTDLELAREHGGSDTYWRLRKKDYRAALDAMTTEAGKL